MGFQQISMRCFGLFTAKGSSLEPFLAAKTTAFILKTFNLVYLPYDQHQSIINRLVVFNDSHLAQWHLAKLAGSLNHDTPNPSGFRDGQPGQSMVFLPVKSGGGPTPRTITEHPTFNKNLDGTMDAILMLTM